MGRVGQLCYGEYMKSEGEGSTDASLCPVYHRAVELIGRRWSGAILAILADGPHRFNEIGARIPGISGRLLAKRLRDLEEEGLVTREVTSSRPVCVSYELTAKGAALKPVLAALHDWARHWLAEAPESSLSR